MKSNREAPISHRVASRVRQLRLAQGLSVAALVQMMNLQGYQINQATVYERERGRHRMTVEEMVAFAKVLRVSPQFLLDEPNCPVCLDVPLTGFTCDECHARGVNLLASQA